MLKYLRFPLRASLSLLCGALMLTSCDADTDSLEPSPLVGTTTSSFTLVDSIKVDAFFQSSNPDLYQTYKDKTYKVEAQNKLQAYYYEENGGVTLFFKDTSSVQERSWVSFHFKNRTIKNLPATLSLKDASQVCVQNGQSFKDGSAALAPGCLSVLDGTISLDFNASTNVLNGEVKELKLGLEYYVPDYAFPNRAGNVFKSSGSNRNLTISFQNVKSYQER